MNISKMSSFNVLLILTISALTSAYPVQSPYPEYIHPPIPYMNYQVLVNRPYPAPNTFPIEGPEADQFISYVDSTPFEQLPPPVPQRSKAHPFSRQKEEVQDVVEDVLKLLIDQRLCEITNANNAPITKRSVNQRFAARATPTSETSSFTQQQLAFLKDLKPEDIRQLIKLLIPAAPAPVTNRTAPVQQELPEPTTFYMPTPVWQSTLQGLPPTLYQSHLLPLHPFEHQQIIYEPFGPAEEAQFHLMKPYVESPVAPPIALNKIPPIPSPFVYSIQISAPLHNYQTATRPLTVVPNNQMVFKPPTVNPPSREEVVTSKPQAVEKLQSIFSESRILLDKDATTKGQVTSTEKIQDLGTSPTSKVDASNVTVGKPDGEAVKRTAKSAASGESEARVAENEQLLEVFKAIREDLMKDNPCRVLTPKRRAINERPSDFVGKQIYQNYLSRHAIPPATLSSKRHNPPTKVLYHKYPRHTPLHSTNW